MVPHHSRQANMLARVATNESVSSPLLSLLLLRGRRALVGKRLFAQPFALVF